MSAALPDVRSVEPLYVKVHWSGDPTCGAEQTIPVPRHAWSAEFARAVEDHLAC